MKGKFKDICIGIIIGGIVFGGMGVAAVTLEAEQIAYTPTDSTFKVSNTKMALDELYHLSQLGNASSTDLLIGKEALVGGKKIIGSMVNNGTWINTPTEKGKVIIPEGYHNGSGYVDTTVVYDQAILDSTASYPVSVYVEGSGAIKVIVAVGGKNIINTSVGSSTPGYYSGHNLSGTFKP